MWQGNEFHYIRQAFSQSLEEKQRTQLRLDQQSRALHTNFLRSPLEGRHQPAPLDELLSTYEISFPHPLYCVIFLHIERLNRDMWLAGSGSHQYQGLCGPLSGYRPLHRRGGALPGAPAAPSILQRGAERHGLRPGAGRGETACFTDLGKTADDTPFYSFEAECRLINHIHMGHFYKLTLLSPNEFREAQAE